MFSTTRGRAIAYEAPKGKPVTLLCIEETPEPAIPFDEAVKLAGEQLSAREYGVLREAYNEGAKAPVALRPVLSNLQRATDKARHRVYEAADKLQPCPRLDTRECLYVAGKSGSGKSTYTAAYARAYMTFFPKNRVILFSRVSEDPALDPLDPIRVSLDDPEILQICTTEFLANSLCIFDDCDTLPKAQRARIDELKEDILQTGRHHAIYIVITSHNITDFHKTRLVLNECTSITVFPKKGSHDQIQHALHKYMGVPMPVIKKILRLQSHWITVGNHAPQFVFHEHGAFFF